MEDGGDEISIMLYNNVYIMVISYTIILLVFVCLLFY